MLSSRSRWHLQEVVVKISGENSHQPFQRREQRMHRFAWARSLQKRVPVHAPASNHVNTRRSFTHGLADCRSRKIEAHSHLPEVTTRRQRAGSPNRRPMRSERELCCLTCLRVPTSFCQINSSFCETS